MREDTALLLLEALRECKMAEICTQELHRLSGKSARDCGKFLKESTASRRKFQQNVFYITSEFVVWLEKMLERARKNVK